MTWRAIVVGVTLVLSACGAPSASEDDGAPSADLPAYCATTGGEDADFWSLVEQSCREATDGDIEQARALRRALKPLDAADVADFHRTLVRLNHALDTPELREASDRCAPGLGLGDDLSTDFRSWVVAHGQAAYEAVRDDPALVADFPDFSAGCGMGEFFGYAALQVHSAKTGIRPGRSELPLLER